MSRGDRLNDPKASNFVLCGYNTIIGLRHIVRGAFGYLLWQRICEGIAKASEGITKADQVLEQAREVHAEVQTGRSRAAELLEQSILQVKQVQQLSATVEQLHNEVVSARKEIGSHETLKALKQELQNARTTLGEATTQLQETVNEVGGREKLESLRHCTFDGNACM